MKAEEDLGIGRVENTIQDNRQKVAADSPGQAGRSVLKYNEEWVAFVTKCSMHPRNVPADFARCPRVWQLWISLALAYLTAGITAKLLRQLAAACGTGQCAVSSLLSCPAGTAVPAIVLPRATLERGHLALFSASQGGLARVLA